MKKTLIAAIVAIALALVAAGCQKADKDLVTPAQPAGQNPHAGAGQTQVPAGVGHKGKVIDVLEAGDYTYIQIEENGSKLWVATVQAKVAKGDIIEFADSPAFANFQSKILNRTFDSVIFADGIRNNGK